jgi:ATP-dependent DNA helicase RecG
MTSQFFLLSSSVERAKRFATKKVDDQRFARNFRVQQISRLHRRDITDLLKGLVDKGMLVSDGRGRAASYRLVGAEAVDLADAVDLEIPQQRSEGMEPSSEGLGARSEGAGVSSAHLDSRSEHLIPSSAHLEPSFSHLDPLQDQRLLGIAAEVNKSGKIDPLITRSAILQLCRGRFLTLNHLAELLNRSPDGLRQRFVKPMIGEGVLERRFPQQPNHEQQAYRTRES